MKIKILNPTQCETCNAKSCKFLTTSTVKEDFHRLSSETSICPTSAIDENGPSETDLKNKSISTPSCVECGLCVRFCAHNNLIAERGPSVTDKFEKLDAIQLKAVTSLYLSLLFDFAANTNRNQSFPFDGYVSTHLKDEAFVEINAGNDSLECLRRLLGDFVTFSASHPISAGIIVLTDLPKAGSHDVFPVIEKMKEFPTTRNLRIYMTTFSILRNLCLSCIPKVQRFRDVLFDCENEKRADYLNRIKSMI